MVGGGGDYALMHLLEEVNDEEQSCSGLCAIVTTNDRKQVGCCCGYVTVCAIA